MEKVNGIFTSGTGLLQSKLYMGFCVQHKTETLSNSSKVQFMDHFMLINSVFDD